MKIKFQVNIAVDIPLKEDGGHNPDDVKWEYSHHDSLEEATKYAEKNFKRDQYGCIQIYKQEHDKKYNSWDSIDKWEYTDDEHGLVNLGTMV